MRRVLVLGTAIVVLAGCKQPVIGKLKVEIPADHVAAVNALVPAEWKDKVVFELGTLVDTTGNKKQTYKLALPSGWKPRVGTSIHGRMAPADADDFGRSASLGAQAQIRVAFDCHGECTKKDWAVEVDQQVYQRFTNGTATGKVTKDERRDTGRTLVFERAADAGSVDGEINILTTWWRKDGPEYFICEAQLAGSAVALAPAFEKACSLVSSE